MSETSLFHRSATGLICSRPVRGQSDLTRQARPVAERVTLPCATPALGRNPPPRPPRRTARTPARARRVVDSGRVRHASWRSGIPSPPRPAAARRRACGRRQAPLAPAPTRPPRDSQSELPRGRLGASRRSASTRRPCTFTNTCAPNPLGGRRVEPRRTSRPDCEPSSRPPRPDAERVVPPVTARSRRHVPRPPATNGSISCAGSTCARRARRPPRGR